MMCWHKWGQWNSLPYRHAAYLGDVIVIQSRICTKCKKVQRRVANPFR